MANSLSSLLQHRPPEACASKREQPRRPLFHQETGHVVLICIGDSVWRYYRSRWVFQTNSVLLFTLAIAVLGAGRADKLKAEKMRSREQEAAESAQKRVREKRLLDRRDFLSLKDQSFDEIPSTIVRWSIAVDASFTRSHTPWWIKSTALLVEARIQVSWERFNKQERVKIIDTGREMILIVGLPFLWETFWSWYRDTCTCCLTGILDFFNAVVLFQQVALFLIYHSPFPNI